MRHQIYADNAATTQMSEKSLKTLIDYINSDYANASQPYSFARYGKKILKEARELISNAIGAQPEEIYFTSGGTESDNWVINDAIKKQKNIITSNIEHHAILNPCLEAINRGIKVQFLEADFQGRIQPSTLEKKITEGSLVSIMFANNEIGTIQPIHELSKIAHKHNCIFHTDAVQAIGHIPINVSELGIDLLSASAHKFNGPKGIGFLYIRKGIELSPFILGGSQEHGLRAGTENIASIISMAIALKENTEDIEKNCKHITSCEDSLLEVLRQSAIDFMHNGDHYNHIPGNINLSFKGTSGEMILHRLDLKGIQISTGSACDSVQNQISHVIRAIGIESSYATGTVRISLGKYNTIEESKIIGEELVNIFKSKA